MTYPIAQSSYSVGTGTSSNQQFITILKDRSPTSSDIQYSPAQRWVNTSTFAEWILLGFISSGGAVTANWEQISPGGGAVTETLTGNSGGAISPDGSNNINTLGTGSITIAGSGNTLTTQLTGLTNHYALVGAGTATITSVSPSTSGFVMTSNGVASDPSFQSVTASGAITTITGNSGGAESPSSGNFNVLGTGSITVAGTANTETVQLTGLTNHNVLLGAGTATVTKVAPSATSGVPFISQGAAADPAFGTAVVAGGGTGTTSFTAYSVICGGTTSTNPLQNVSGVGTTGQVLTSNGAAALPTWQSQPPVSWTPNLQFGGAQVGITYTTQTGYYVQQGSIVYYWFNVVLSNKGSSVGTATISNMPVSTGANGGFNVAMVSCSGVGFGGGSQIGFVNNIGASTVGYFFSNVGAGPAAVIVNTDFVNTSQVIASGFYFTN